MSGETRNDDTMTVDEAVKELGIGRTLFYKLVAKGSIHPQRNPLYHPKRGKVRILRSEVEALKAGRARDES